MASAYFTPVISQCVSSLEWSDFILLSGGWRLLFETPAADVSASPVPQVEFEDVSGSRRISRISSLPWRHPSASFHYCDGFSRRRRVQLSWISRRDVGISSTLVSRFSGRTSRSLTPGPHCCRCGPSRLQPMQESKPPPLLRGLWKNGWSTWRQEWTNTTLSSTATALKFNASFTNKETRRKRHGAETWSSLAWTVRFQRFVSCAGSTANADPIVVARQLLREHSPAQAASLDFSYFHGAKNTMTMCFTTTESAYVALEALQTRLSVTLKT